MIKSGPHQAVFDFKYLWHGDENAMNEHDVHTPQADSSTIGVQRRLQLTLKWITINIWPCTGSASRGSFYALLVFHSSKHLIEPMIRTAHQVIRANWNKLIIIIDVHFSMKCPAIKKLELAIDLFLICLNCWLWHKEFKWKGDETYVYHYKFYRKTQNNELRFILFQLNCMTWHQHVEINVTEYRRPGQSQMENQ